MILIDTDVLIEIVDKNSNKGDLAINKLRSLHENICISSINLHEFNYGIEKYGKKLREIPKIHVIPFTENDAILSSKIESKLNSKGLSVNEIDCMICSICINNNFPIYTFNITHFNRFTEFGLVMIWD